MKHTVWALTCLLFELILPHTAAADGRYFEVQYAASEQPGELSLGVTYTLWVPDTAEPLRAVIVHQHGCGTGACKGGETAACDVHWQALARKWNCGLLGPSYHQQDGQNCRLWCDPRNGSQHTFLRALDDLAEQAERPELSRVPWCLWGHSGGGFWSSLMQTLYPERIVAIWFRSGTAFATWEKEEIPRPEIPQAAYDIPFMCNPGAKENGDARFRGAWDGTLAMFRAYRAQGAAGGFAPDPRTGHECGDSRYLAIPFFDACLQQRLPDVSASDDEPKLKPVDLSRAWYAEPLSDVALPLADFQGDKQQAVWLPDERVARAWMDYVKSGAVEDQSPPAAPLQLTAISSDDGSIELTWDVHADLESGLQAFRIVRDGQLLARLPETDRGRFGRPLFQVMSYHDTPERPLPEMKYVDRNVDRSAAHEYQVITVNSVGLESPPATIHVAAQECASTTAADAPQVRVKNIRRVFHNGEHNAFTDLCRFQGRYYLTFRSCPDGHAVHPTASIIILTSEDAQKWRQVHQFHVPLRDTRDPHFLVFQDKLFVYTGTWYSGETTLPRDQYDLNLHLGYAAMSADGTEWRSPILLEGTFGHYIWRAATFEGQAYLCGRRKKDFAIGPKGEGREVESAMLVSDDGLVWKHRALFQVIEGDETAFLFEPNGDILAIGRRGSAKAQLLKSSPPYETWERRELDRYIGGPLLVRWGERYVVGGRKSIGGGPTTALYWLVDDQLHQFAELPSGGDTSYPGFVQLSSTTAIVSWYSSHERDADGKTITAIYMAELEIED